MSLSNIYTCRHSDPTTITGRFAPANFFEKGCVPSASFATRSINREKIY